MSGTQNTNSSWYPGQVWEKNKQVTALEDRKSVELIVTNTGDRPIQVGSHFHFFETNRQLDFNRNDAYGMRLSIPSGTAARFEPGQSHRIKLIEISGERVIYGFNGLVNGPLDEKGIKEKALAKAKELGFKGVHYV